MKLSLSRTIKLKSGMISLWNWLEHSSLVTWISTLQRQHSSAISLYKNGVWSRWSRVSLLFLRERHHSEANLFRISLHEFLHHSCSVLLQIKMSFIDKTSSGSWLKLQTQGIRCSNYGEFRTVYLKQQICSSCPVKDWSVLSSIWNTNHFHF